MSSCHPLLGRSRTHFHYVILPPLRGRPRTHFHYVILPPSAWSRTHLHYVILPPSARSSKDPPPLLVNIDVPCLRAPPCETNAEIGIRASFYINKTSYNCWRTISLTSTFPTVQIVLTWLPCTESFDLSPPVVRVCRFNNTLKHQRHTVDCLPLVFSSRRGTMLVQVWSEHETRVVLTGNWREAIRAVLRLCAVVPTGRGRGTSVRVPSQQFLQITT